MRIGVLTSGGDSPGMNAAIRAVVKRAIAGGHEAIGILRGYDGVLAGETIPLRLVDVDAISRHGGTRLGSARSLVFPTPEGQGRARAQLRALRLDVDIRETILGHVVRGGSPSAMDRMLAQRLGTAAVAALEAGASDVMLAWEAPSSVGAPTGDPSVRRVPLAEVLAETRRMLDGTSDPTRRRIAMLAHAEALLAL